MSLLYHPLRSPPVAIFQTPKCAGCAFCQEPKGGGSGGGKEGGGREFKESHMIDEVSRVDIPACKSSPPLSQPKSDDGPSLPPLQLLKATPSCHPESKTFLFFLPSPFWETKVRFKPAAAGTEAHGVLSCPSSPLRPAGPLWSSWPLQALQVMPPRSPREHGEHTIWREGRLKKAPEAPHRLSKRTRLARLHTAPANFAAPFRKAARVSPEVGTSAFASEGPTRRSRSTAALPRLPHTHTRPSDPLPSLPGLSVPSGAHGAYRLQEAQGAHVVPLGAQDLVEDAEAKTQLAVRILSRFRGRSGGAGGRCRCRRRHRRTSRHRLHFHGSLPASPSPR